MEPRAPRPPPHGTAHPTLTTRPPWPCSRPPSFVSVTAAAKVAPGDAGLAGDLINTTQ